MSGTGGKTFLHTWEATPGYLLEHHSTGLKFMCAERDPRTGQAGWDCYMYPMKADDDAIDRLAAEAGMDTGELLKYLMDTAIELAEKNRRKAGNRWR